jgi:hypothetical protein
MKYDFLTVKDATHLLSCRHAIGRHALEYQMSCCIIAWKPEKVKVLVFGERYWSGRDHIKKIRYVDNKRLTIK